MSQHAATERPDGLQFGMTLSSEDHGPTALVDQARAAEELGFDFVSISDHFHPWVTEQGHSPFVWSVLGAIAAATERLPVAVGVTCPIVRIHPAIVAHAAATTALLLEDRFTLGLGTGEALNEHILGHRWSPPETRRAMLAEAIRIMRQLWTGETVDHRGDFYQVENARLFDPPPGHLPLVISGFGRASMELAAELGDGFWGHEPDPEVVERYEQAGGTGPRYAQVRVCWDPDVQRARETVHRRWPNQGLSGQLAQDLPTFTHFEQATSMLTVEQTAGSVPCGPDAAPILDAVHEFVDAGYDHVYLHQVGEDMDGFLRCWAEELRPELQRIPVRA
jgi:G6PDH family F420-dependent oxidoreductase